MSRKNLFWTWAITAVIGLCSSNLYAQEGSPESNATPSDAESKAEIAKKLANPIANMISVPFQWNWDQKTGMNGQGHDQTLLFQPVIPMSLSGGNNVIFFLFNFNFHSANRFYV